MENEASLNCFDIDDTLMHTQNVIHVVDQEGKILHKLNSAQFAQYTFKPGEKIDYADLRNAQSFAASAKPNKAVFNTAKRMMDKFTSQHQRFIIVTARADFDDKDVFLNTFRKYGFDIDRTHVYRAGNINLPTAEAKKLIIRRELMKHPYKTVRLFDDASKNLDAFLELKDEFPHIDFKAILITSNGAMVQYGNIKEDGAPANAAGAGGIAGIGIGSKGEAPGPASVLSRLRRKPLDEDTFAGEPVFKVSDDFYHRCYHGKKKFHTYEKYVGSDEHGEKIRQYGRKNYDKPIVIQNEKTGAMLYLKYGKK